MSLQASGACSTGKALHTKLTELLEQLTSAQITPSFWVRCDALKATPHRWRKIPDTTSALMQVRQEEAARLLNQASKRLGRPPPLHNMSGTGTHRWDRSWAAMGTLRPVLIFLQMPLATARPASQVTQIILQSQDQGRAQQADHMTTQPIAAQPRSQ